MWSEFQQRDIAVIAVAQEDKDVSSHAQILKRFKSDRKFEIVVDVDRRKTSSYDRTSAYLIDEQGVVRQVFPMLIHSRPSWRAILAEFDRIMKQED